MAKKKLQFETYQVVNTLAMGLNTDPHCGPKNTQTIQKCERWVLNTRHSTLEQGYAKLFSALMKNPTQATKCEREHKKDTLKNEPSMCKIKCKLTWPQVKFVTSMATGN